MNRQPASQIDIAAFWPQGPRTRISGELQAGLDGKAADTAQAPATEQASDQAPGSAIATTAWQLTKRLNNAMPGPWDRQRLPLDQIEAAVRYDGQQWLLEQAQIAIGSGSIDAQGRFEPATKVFEGQAKVQRLDPAALYSLLEAAPLQGELRASTTAEQQVDFSVDIQAAAAPAGAKRQPLRIEKLATKGRVSLEDFERAVTAIPEVQTVEHVLGLYDYRLRVVARDIADFERRLDDDISAVIISHMRGHTSDMDAIMALCNARDIPVIEDAAHSLGTEWHGQKIGTIGAIGCFSFQSYKLVNAGEGGILITDDADLVARAVIMSGAYEHTWQKHKAPEGDNTGALELAFARWQNMLPLYNLRLNNMSAAMIRPQLLEVPRRVRDGRANHDYVAGLLNASPWLTVPEKLAPEERAPDSIQFNIVNMDDDQVLAFQAAANARGVKVQVFGRSTDNARAFWNWQFIKDLPELPKTRAMLMNACDVRLPARLTKDELDIIAGALTGAAEDVMTPQQAAYGT